MLLVISDIHDRKENLDKVLKDATKNFIVDYIAVLGDYVSAKMLLLIAKYKINTIGILGNNDGDPLTMYQKLQENNYKHFKLVPRDFYLFNYKERKIFMTHYPEIGQIAAKSQEFDAVLYGHNHLIFNKKIGKTLLCNPGEIAGTKTHIISYAIYDHKQNNAEIIELNI